MTDERTTRNSERAPITAPVTLHTVVYATWQCPGEGCGSPITEGHNAIVDELSKVTTLHCKCGDCGQRMPFRMAGQGVVAVPSAAQTKALLDSIGKKTH